MRKKARGKQASPAKRSRSGAAPLWPFTFRALADPDLVRETTARIQSEVARQPEEDSTAGDSRFGYACYQVLYRALLKSLYYTFGVFNQYASRFRRPPKDRPIRVLRMTSTITQGGVAKVCLQTVLRLSPRDVETHLLVFTERRAVVPSLDELEHVELIGRRLRLWPCSYKPKLLLSLRVSSRSRFWVSFFTPRSPERSCSTSPRRALHFPRYVTWRSLASMKRW